MARLNKEHVIYHDIEQGSPEWQKFREYQFTGSNAEKMLSSFGAGSWAMSKPSEFSGNFYTRRGHLLESEAVELYEKIKKVTVEHTGCVTNTKYQGCLYSPDGFLPDRTIEVKCFSPKKHLDTIEHASIGISAQCHFGQLIMERKLTDLILYCPKPEIPVDKMLVIIPIKYDKDIQANFKRIIKAYHDKRIQPKI